MRQNGAEFAKWQKRKIIKHNNFNDKPYQYKPSDKTYHATIKYFDDDNGVCNLLSISLQTDITYGIFY